MFWEARPRVLPNPDADALQYEPSTYQWYEAQLAALDQPRVTTYELQHPTAARIRELQAMPYPEYLRSLEWAETRRQALGRAEHHCNRCGVTDGVSPLDVHHLSYEHVGHEPLEELEVLCRPCHAEEHGITE